MYLEHFQLNDYPFVLTPNTHYFCNLSTYQEALNVLLLSLKSGEGFIKIIGEVGSGKTMLCHQLLNNLGDTYVTAYISNPFIDSSGLRKAVAQELEIPFHRKTDQHELLNLINQRLLDLNREGKKVVIIVDEAQVLSFQALESLRLLSNLETESAKLLHIILFGQPELDDRLRQPELRQLNERISFSYYLKPMDFSEQATYINYRLTRAGSTQIDFFTSKSLKLLHKASRGIPRLTNILCHKALMVAFGSGHRQINHQAVLLAIRDTDSVQQPKKSRSSFLVNILIVLLTAVFVFEVFQLIGPYL